VLLCTGLFLQIERYTAIRLTEGASNKIIARKLVITESTVKVHMKAILRKLRLQNRTQAAIWARTHLGALLENAAA
jgi:DNA-binding NarL/FixJ family response regulator